MLKGRSRARCEQDAPGGLGCVVDVITCGNVAGGILGEVIYSVRKLVNPKNRWMGSVMVGLVYDGGHQEQPRTYFNPGRQRLGNHSVSKRPSEQEGRRG